RMRSSRFIGLRLYRTPEALSCRVSTDLSLLRILPTPLTVVTGRCFMKLNPQQEEVANHIHGRILTLAGPGSGKTRTLTERTGRLIRAGYNPASILSLTLTNKPRD